jgi:hypothetical protein
MLLRTHHKHRIDNVFKSGTSEMDINRLDRYVDCTAAGSAQAVAAMTFWDLLATCRLKGCTPIGLKHQDGVASKVPNKWIFNPTDKSAPLGLSAEDLIVVLAPEEVRVAEEGEYCLGHGFSLD